MTDPGRAVWPGAGPRTQTAGHRCAWWPMASSQSTENSPPRSRWSSVSTRRWCSRGCAGAATVGRKGRRTCWRSSPRRRGVPPDTLIRRSPPGSTPSVRPLPWTCPGSEAPIGRCGRPVVAPGGVGWMAPTSRALVDHAGRVVRFRRDERRVRSDWTCACFVSWLPCEWDRDRGTRVGLVPPPAPLEPRAQPSPTPSAYRHDLSRVRREPCRPTG